MDSPASGDASASASRPITRTYVACVTCRARKVKCQIGATPPCGKCKREHRDCIFDTTRKSTRHRNPPRWAQSHDNERMAGSSTPEAIDLGTSLGGGDHPAPSSRAGEHSEQAPSASTSNGHQMVDPPARGPRPSISEHLVNTVMTGSADALDTLSHAAQTARMEQRSDQQSGDKIGVTRSLSGVGLVMSRLSAADDATLDIWDRSRFVRQGWFTAQEAVTFVDLYYQCLAPLSTVNIDQFRPHSGHVSLICEEPMLCCTLLTITSRLFILPGAGGLSRSQNIHQRLWEYCELLLKRVVLGQEKHSTAKIRTVGTIESFLLLSDWHPRAVHFAPETQGWDAYLITPDYDRGNRRQRGDEAPFSRWREDVFEPVNRANRMSWMLLGLAGTLGHEIGVLGNGSQDPGNSTTGAQRSSRIKRLISTYTTQTAVRLGYPISSPETLSSATSLGNTGHGRPISDPAWKAYMDSWMELVLLSQTARAMLHHSHAQSKAQLLDGQYVILLEHLTRSFSKWHTEFSTASQAISEPLKVMLLLEYYHLRAYSGSVAVQAVVERSTAAQSDSGPGNHAQSFANAITNFDAKSIQGVIQDSRAVLEIASQPPFIEWLPFTPTRIRVLIVSASVFLLKATTIIGRQTDTQAVVNTLGRCTAALKQYSLDDMDFASRYADLISRHTAHLMANLELNNSTTHVSADQVINGPGNGDSWARTGAMNFDSSDCQTNFNVDGQRDYQLPIGGLIDSDDQSAWFLDPDMAVFGPGTDNVAFGFEADSLDFLWGLNE